MIQSQSSRRAAVRSGREQPMGQLEEVEVVMDEPLPQEVPDVMPDKRRKM